MYVLVLLGVCGAAVCLAIFVDRADKRTLKRDQAQPDMLTERLRAVARRYENDEITLEELEQQTDDVLNGRVRPIDAPAYALDPRWQSGNSSGGTVFYDAPLGTASVRDFEYWVERRDQIEDAHLKRERINRINQLRAPF